MTMDTRRRFLQKSIVGTTTSMLAPALHGQERIGQAAPNDRIGIGCVGVGGRAGSLLRMFAAQKDVDVVAIADIDARRIPEAVAIVLHFRRTLTTRADCYL